MKSAYIAKYRHGLAGPAVVAASDADEARREAFAYARFTTACIPEWYGEGDVVASVEPAPQGVSVGSGGYGCRPTVQTEACDGFRPTTAKDAVASMQSPDFSKLERREAASSAV